MKILMEDTEGVSQEAKEELRTLIRKVKEEYSKIQDNNVLKKLNWHVNAQFTRNPISVEVSEEEIYKYIYDDVFSIFDTARFLFLSAATGIEDDDERYASFGSALNSCTFSSDTEIFCEGYEDNLQLIVNL